MKYRYGWHVLYVKSHWEKKVHESLESASLESFLPLIKTVRQWSDRKKTVWVPLFRSYVFVNINSSLDFYKALSVNGVYRYVQFGKKYALVTNKDMDTIRQIMGVGEITDIQTQVNIPKIGEKRKILSGPLTGLNCEVVQIGNNKKISVRIDSLKNNIVAGLIKIL